MASKSSPKTEYVCRFGLNYPGPDGPLHRSEEGDPYLGDNAEELLEQGLIVPASAGSSQPGDEEGK
jgi:hypothetical protein